MSKYYRKKTFFLLTILALLFSGIIIILLLNHSFHFINLGLGQTLTNGIIGFMSLCSLCLVVWDMFHI